MIIIITTNRVFTDVRLNFKQLRLTAVMSSRDMSELQLQLMPIGFRSFHKSTSGTFPVHKKEQNNSR